MVVPGKLFIGFVGKMSLPGFTASSSINLLWLLGKYLSAGLPQPHPPPHRATHHELFLK